MPSNLSTSTMPFLPIVPPNKRSPISITCYTDPVCIWCWGSEPILRALETHYPGRVQLRYVMGGMIASLCGSPHEESLHACQLPSAVNKDFSNLWEQSVTAHGMPVLAKDFALFSSTNPSSYPQNIAYKAAQLVDEGKANKLLRRIREATAVEGMITSERDVLIDLAMEVDLDIRSFLLHLEDGSAEEAFQQDVALRQTKHITLLPTAEISYNGRHMLLTGFQSFATFVDALGLISYGTLRPTKPENTDDALFALMEQTPRLAEEEIRQALGLPNNDLVEQRIARLITEEQVVLIPTRNSYFIQRKMPMPLK